MQTPDFRVTKKIKGLRRQGKLPTDINVGVFEDNKEIQIFCDKGRVQRPVLSTTTGCPSLYSGAAFSSLRVRSSVIGPGG